MKKTIPSDSRKAAISAKDLLTMSSPVDCKDWNEMSRGNEKRMYILEDWTKFFRALPIRGHPAWDLPPAKQPYGRTFSYCTARVQLLGQAIARATGEPVTNFIEDHIFTPIGITAEEYSW